MATETSTDALSDVFEQIEVQGFVTGGFAVRGPWSSATAVRRPLKLVALVAGGARVTVDGPGGASGPFDMEPGDVLLLNNRAHLEVHGRLEQGSPQRVTPDTSFTSMELSAADLSTDDVVVGGWIQVNPAGQAFLGAALPGVVHVHASTPSASRLAELVAQLFAEASAPRLGSAFAIRQNGQLILLEVLRAYLEQEQPPIGWLRLFADESLAPALRLMHEHPDRAWGLVDLAQAAGISRMSFAGRFREVAGTPPLTYLSRWRMVLAQRALRDPDVRVGALAARLGYGSESAFSTAFKRSVGLSPAHYRQAHRGRSAEPARLGE